MYEAYSTFLWGLIIYLGHKQLYSHGVLHRDISQGNIIIAWDSLTPITFDSTKGCLIDLDRAKKGTEKEVIADVKPTSEESEIMEHNKKTIAFALQVGRHLKIHDDVPLHAFKIYREPREYSDYAVDTIQHALRFGYLSNDDTCSAQNLFWE